MESPSNVFKVRYLNGYRMLYRPSHETAMKSKNWDGYVYEHILVTELNIGRKLTKNEVVHHLDMDRLNNRFENLLILDRGQHAKLHQWLDKGALLVKTNNEQGMNSVKSKSSYSYCEICGLTLQFKQIRYCSDACESISIRSKHGNRTKPIPSKDELIQLLELHSREAVGRMYNVSGNAVKKWMKQYEESDMIILSQAKDTSLEGAETSGEI